MAGWSDTAVTQALADAERLQTLLDQDEEDAAEACDKGWNGFVQLYFTVCHHASLSMCVSSLSVSKAKMAHSTA